MTYKEQIQHPKWQKKRLEILERDGFKCTFCGSEEKTLHVHHLRYKNAMIWDYDNEDLITYCAEHHHLWHSLNDSIKSMMSMELLPLMKLWDFVTSFPIDDVKKMSEIYARASSCNSNKEQKHE